MRVMGLSKQRITLTGTENSIYSLVVLPNQMIATGSINEIIVWETNNFSLIKKLNGHNYSIESLAVMDDDLLVSSNRPISAQDKYTIIIWNVKSGKKLGELKSEDFGCFTVCLRKFLVTGLINGKITIWLWNQTLNIAQPLITLSGHTGIITKLIELKDGRLVSSSYDLAIKIWNNFNVNVTLKGHSDFVVSLAELPNNRLASSSEDQTIKIWDILTGILLHTLTTREKQSFDHLVLLDGGLTLASSSSSSINLWDITNYKKIKKLDDNHKIPNYLAVLDDGRFISVSSTKSLTIWN